MEGTCEILIDKMNAVLMTTSPREIAHVRNRLRTWVTLSHSKLTQWTVDGSGAMPALTPRSSAHCGIRLVASPNDMAPVNSRSMLVYSRA